MNDNPPSFVPASLANIKIDTKIHGFTMASDDQTGSLLRTLAGSKPAGRFLELGTGTGLATAWILSGMDPRSSLTTVDNDETVVAVARRHLGDDPRVSFVIGDGAAFLATAEKQSYDFVFADAWPGKFELLDSALNLLTRGGFYVVDDLSPQPNWPDGHQPQVQRLLGELEARRDAVWTELRWSTGLAIATKR